MIKKWHELPDFMRTKEVKVYYDILVNKRISLLLKRVFDIGVSFILLILFLIPMIVIGMIIAIESKGGIFYRQERITAYGKKFKIHKFRTMVADADQNGLLVTISNDYRVTPMGKILRKYRLDELPQIMDVFLGNMSFVGTRPEVPKFVKQYTNEMMATLLLPAGITSEASIRYKDEARLLIEVEDAEKIYVEEILPEKMKYNLESIKKFGFGREVMTMFRTVCAVLGKEYK